MAARPEADFGVPDFSFEKEPLDHWNNLRPCFVELGDGEFCDDGGLGVSTDGTSGPSLSWFWELGEDPFFIGLTTVGSTA